MKHFLRRFLYYVWCLFGGVIYTFAVAVPSWQLARFSGREVCYIYDPCPNVEPSSFVMLVDCQLIRTCIPDPALIVVAWSFLIGLSILIIGLDLSKKRRLSEVLAAFPLPPVFIVGVACASEIKVPILFFLMGALSLVILGPRTGRASAQGGQREASPDIQAEALRKEMLK